MICPTCHREVSGLSCEDCLMAADYREYRAAVAAAEYVTLFDGKHISLGERSKAVCGAVVAVHPRLKQRLIVRREYAAAKASCSACRNAVTPAEEEPAHAG